jgi:hypothetical protein
MFALIILRTGLVEIKVVENTKLLFFFLGAFTRIQTKKKECIDKLF